MSRLTVISDQLTNSTKPNPSQKSQEEIKDLYDQVYTKSQKYHHIRDIPSIQKALMNPKLIGMIPKLQVSQEVINMCPMNIKNYITNMRQWNIMQDGPEHKKVRQSFPTEYMIYPLTKQNNYQFLCKVAEDLIEKAIKKSSTIDVKESIGDDISIAMLCRIFGFHFVSDELKQKLILWSARSADTGQIFPLDENADYYEEAHQFFIKSIEEITVALQKKDTSKYDLNGLIAKMIKDQVITDKKVMANQCNMWLLGGSHNPSNMVSLGVGMLLQHKEQFQKLRSIDQPSQAQSMIHRVVNEVLRILPPAHVIVRTADEDLVIQNNNQDLQLKKGDSVILHLQDSSKNQNIENNLEFDIFREKAPHMGFGHGPHRQFFEFRCMGGETGQLQAEVVIEKLLFADILQDNQKLRDPELVEFKWQNSGSFKEIHSIKVKYN